VARETATAWLLSPDAFSDDFLETQFRLAIEAQRKRDIDDKIDVTVTPFYERFAGSRQLFHTVNHPMRPVLAHIVNQCMSLCGFPATISYDGADYMDWLHIPALPSMRAFYARHRPAWLACEAWSAGEPAVRIQETRLSLADFVERMSQEIWRQPQADLRAAIALSWTVADVIAQLPHL
jgi:hypothetical protein